MPAQRPPAGRGRPGRVAGLVVVVLLAGLAALGIWTLQPPAPEPADAPAGEFSAARAFELVEQIAAQTHVAGSAANDRVVDGLVDRLTALGLDTRVQNAVGTGRAEPGTAAMARVRNVVAVLPGADSTGRLFLVAHHDSVETGPGAADDAAGVAALLESVRALTEGRQLRNDVVVVLTDAEEACLCGAEAFAASHPLAAAGGVVLNVEARGQSGPPIMFETSPGNAPLAGAYAAAAPHPVASSFAVEVYRALPNDTDFSVLLDDGGFTGLNTAFIDGAAGYHTPQDVPQRLDRGTLQALGDNTLALARELGGRDLAALAEPGGEDATYFPLLGHLVVHPGSWVWPLAAAAGIAVLALVEVLRRRGVSSLPRTLAGTASALVPLVVAPLSVQALWWAMVQVRPGYAAMIDPWRPGWFRLSAVLLVLAVVLLWYAIVRRGIGPAALATGALVWLAVGAVLLAGWAPGGAYLLTWPVLAGALAGLVGALASSRIVRLVAVLAAGAVAVVVLAPTVALFLPALGLSSGAVAGTLVALLAIALLPAFELLFPDPDRPRPRRGRVQAAAVPALALVTAWACAAAGLSVDRFDADHPVPSQLVYALDADGGRAWWASTEAEPGEYTSRYVEGRAVLPADFPYLRGREVATGPAQAADLPPPEVVVVSDQTSGDRRDITVRVTPRRADVRLLVLDVATDGGSVTGGRIAGRAVPEAALGQQGLWLTFHAPGEGVQASFTVEGGGAVRLRAVDGSDGLAGLPGFEPRPDGVDAAGTHSSDLVVVATTTELG